MTDASTPVSGEHAEQITTLTLARPGIHTRDEHIIFMREDCEICKSEGFEALTRIQVHHENKTIIATLNVVSGNFVAKDEAALSESAWKELNADEGDTVRVSHLPPIKSFGFVRRKIYGNKLSESQLSAIVKDVTEGKFSTVQLAGFVTACVGERLDNEEIAYLTKAMVKSGEQLEWDRDIVVDKHSVGGLPGNRTTPIVVSIVAEAGLTIPKTSSRAITSPAGTADTMETMTSVALSLDEIRRVVDRTGGCLVWGGSVNLSPADEILIRVERALNIDSEGQMIASVLSKKSAAGSTHTVIDIPVGPTAKVRSEEAAYKLDYQLKSVGDSIGLKVQNELTDGRQPIGRGIGPALEAHDVLKVLRNEPDAPEDLREKSLRLAAAVLELSGTCGDRTRCEESAREILRSGRALEKFMDICEAQGGFREPGTAPYTHEVRSERSGAVKSIDNRVLARVAKLAGAPSDKTAGVEFRVLLDQAVEKGDLLYRIHAESKGELEYAVEYEGKQDEIVEVR